MDKILIKLKGWIILLAFLNDGMRQIPDRDNQTGIMNSMGYNVYMAFGFDLGNHQGELTRPKDIDSILDKAKSQGISTNTYDLYFLQEFTLQQNQPVQDDVFIMSHTQSDEYAVVIRESVVDGYRGVCTKVDESKLRSKKDWVDKIKDFCVKYNIPYTEPSWLLLSNED